MPSTSSKDAALLTHYKRMLAARQAPASGFESFEAPGAAEANLSRGDITERVESADQALRRIVKDYLNNAPDLLKIVDRLVAQGGAALQYLAAGNVEALVNNPPALEGLEAIV